MVERVLIVDDDPVQRRLVENIVGQAGYETAAVDGGEAALEAMLATASAPYDCVVLDLVMPDLDGLGVLGRMREAGLDIPVIVQAAHGGVDNVVTIAATNRSLMSGVKSGRFRQGLFYRLHVFPLMVPSLRQAISEPRPRRTRCWPRSMMSARGSYVNHIWGVPRPRCRFSPETAIPRSTL